jgi:hypothetical protein
MDTRIVGSENIGAPAAPCLVFSAYLSAWGEPTSGLEPLTCSLRVCGRAFLGVAGVCNSCIDKGFSVPCIAHYCRVLRPG